MTSARRRRAATLLALLPLLSVACIRAQKVIPPPRPQPVPSMFTPVAMRLHPTFSRVRNWSGGNDPDGIEAELEFTDQFGDTAKAEGTVTFEIFAYRTGAADVRGQAVSTPFVGTLLTPEDQKAHWSNTTRTYSFKLSDTDLKFTKPYVLTATFDPKAGNRSFARIILQPTHTDDKDAKETKDSRDTKETGEK